MTTTTKSYKNFIQNENIEEKKTFLLCMLLPSRLSHCIDVQYLLLLNKMKSISISYKYKKKGKNILVLFQFLPGGSFIGTVKSGLIKSKHFAID